MSSKSIRTYGWSALASTLLLTVMPAFDVAAASKAASGSNSSWPAIFYSPHQDDEALGMAGAIHEHKQAGRPVWLVLVMDGANDGLLQMMNGQLPCSVPGLHGGGSVTHSFGLTMEQLEWARKAEFAASAKAMGVDEVFIVDDAQGLHAPTSATGNAEFLAQVKRVILSFEEKALARFGGPASHKFVSAAHDKVYPEGRITYDHEMIEKAAQELRRDGIVNDVKFYRVNVYSDPAQSIAEFPPVLTFDLTPEQMTVKRRALDEYKRFVPEAGRYALGFHSIGYTLFENPTGAYHHAKEYLDCSPAGC